MDLASRITLFDNLTGPVMQMVNSLDGLVDNFNLVEASSRDIGDSASFDQVRQQIDLSTVAAERLNNTFDMIDSTIRRNEEMQEQFNQKIIQGNSAAGSLLSTLGKMAAMGAAFLGIGKLTSFIGPAFERIDTMNRFERTVGVITGDTEQAAVALSVLREAVIGTAYGLDTAAAAAQGFLTRGMGLKTATEQVRIWGDAVAFYGKGTNEELETVTDAIGRMYTKGSVDMLQLNRLFNVGINAVQIYADATGQMANAVQDDLSSGKIAAIDFLNTVTAAMDAGLSAGAAKAAGDSWINTFANMRAAITRGWVNFFNNIEAKLSSSGLPTVKEMVANTGKAIENAMGRAAAATSRVLDAVIPVYSFFADNWSLIAPIVGGTVAVMLAYQSAAMGAAIASGIAMTAKGGYVFILSIFDIAAAKATAAQWGLNKAMYANPVGIVIAAIVLLIVIFYAAVAAVNKFAGTSYSATGIIAGAFAMLGAFLYNTFFVLQWNLFAAIANFFANVFNDPVAAVKILFYDLSLTVIGYITSMAKAIESIINKIPGVKADITSGLDNFMGKLEDARQKVKDESEWVEVVQRKEFLDYGAAYSAGYDWGAGIGNKINAITELPDVELSDNFSGIPGDVADIVGNTGKMAGFSEENLKYLRDIAERDAINRFTTAEVNIDFGGVTNQVNSEVDLDGVVNYMAEKTREALEEVAEGVHK